MWRSILLLTVVVSLGAAGASHGEMITLYDGALGTKPTQQGWVMVLNPGWVIDQTWSGGLTTLTTTYDWDYRITYASDWPGPGLQRHPNLPATLDRNPGFDTRFTMQITSESHTGSSESGYSAIAIGSDYLGIELGFWNDAVWAYGVNGQQRTRAETTTGFSPSAALTTYDLTIRGDIYSLKAGGTEILTGSLRDYRGTSIGRQGYCDIPNQIQFGDDSHVGSAVSQIGFIGIETFLLPGDANSDGKIDGADLAIWQQNYDPLGAHVNTWGMGDWNKDGKIDGGDLALWQQNYAPLGYSTLSLGDSLETNAVPEPGTLTLAAACVAGFLFRARRGLKPATSCRED